MRKTAVLLIAAILVLAVAMTGCGPAGGGEPDESASGLPADTGSGAAGSLMVGQVQGIVQEIEEGENLRILVDSDAEVEGLIWVTVTDETDFFEDVGADSSLGISDVSRDFKVGNKVVFYVDVILESYPMQTTALACYENSPE